MQAGYARRIETPVSRVSRSLKGPKRQSTSPLLPAASRHSMGIGATVARIRRRVALEVLDLEPIDEPAPPRVERSFPTQEPPSGHEGETRLRILSLNAWGLPVAPKCTERAVEIANAIENGYEVVVLQEIWHRRERDIIITRAQKAGFHYYHYFQPAIGFPVPLGADSFGTGLLVLSKFPILSATYHSFQLSGRPYALHEADFIANKGVGLLRLLTPGDEIDLYVTHLLANYNELGEPGPGDRYIAHRVGQSYELERFIEATSRNNLTLVCGDFNSPSDCMVLRIQRDLRQLRDAFTDMNNHDGLTFAAEDNKFSHGEHPMRMDYVLYKVNSPRRDELPQHTWHLVASDVFKGFFTDDKGEQFPLSDHFGVTAEFVFSSQPQPLKPCQQELGERSKEKASPVSKTTVPTCDTTTCVHCDAVKTKSLSLRDDKPDSDALSPAARCLQDVQESLLGGRADALSRRRIHLSRSGWSLLLALALVVVNLFIVNLTPWAWVAAMLLMMHTILQYVLAFFFVTLECSTFTELVTEVRLHLHVEYAK